MSERKKRDNGVWGFKTVLMALKFILTTETELPEDELLRSLYTKQGEKWILAVEGAVPKSQLNEFREKNITLSKQLEALGDVAPADAAKAINRVEELEAQLDKDKGKFDELLNKRTEAMKNEFDAKLAAKDSTIGETRGQLKTLKIDQAIQAAGGEFGLRNGAAPDLVARGRTMFDLDDEGNIISKDIEGVQRYNATGDPLAPKDWVQSMTKEAKHLFDESQGSGAGGSGKGGSGMSGIAGNPWSKESFSLTRQCEVTKADPAQAKRLAAQAGKVIG